MVDGFEVTYSILVYVIFSEVEVSTQSVSLLDIPRQKVLEYP